MGPSGLGILFPWVECNYSTILQPASCTCCSMASIKRCQQRVHTRQHADVHDTPQYQQCAHSRVQHSTAPVQAGAIPSGAGPAHPRSQPCRHPPEMLHSSRARLLLLLLRRAAAAGVVTCCTAGRQKLLQPLADLTCGVVLALLLLLLGPRGGLLWWRPEVAPAGVVARCQLPGEVCPCQRASHLLRVRPGLPATCSSHGTRPSQQQARKYLLLLCMHSTFAAGKPHAHMQSAHAISTAASAASSAAGPSPGASAATDAVACTTCGW